MPDRTGYAAQPIPPHVVAGQAVAWGVSPVEAELRLRAVMQMQQRLLQRIDQEGDDVLMWTREGKPLAGRMLETVLGLVGAPGEFVEGRIGLTRRRHAEEVAVTFCPVAEERVDRLPAWWWDTPLGVMCKRARGLT